MISGEAQWTVETVLVWTIDYFKRNSIASARLDAELLLAKACGCQRMQLYLNPELSLTPDEREQVRNDVKQRVAGVPIAYLLGEREFWGLALNVRSGVLIPRPDTEILVEQIHERIKVWKKNNSPDQTCEIAELGTGSGAIPIALASLEKNLRFYCTDISPIALEVATANARKFQSLWDERSNRIQFIRGDRFEMLASGSQFDLIISNPPYIPSNDIQSLQKEVRVFEPHEALDGGTSGMNFYDYLLTKAPLLLKHEGWLCVEMGFDQAESLTLLIQQHSSMKLVKIVPDYAGHDRVALLQHCKHSPQ
ncbi:MAG: peptide chain release factor N(5)-glutamine methyltransferase [SAR324 cluster bacterium]|nr:peptide chain release factor N(5)-glutamine methyltransferase [SAR324 cluster bacterium]